MSAGPDERRDDHGIAARGFTRVFDGVSVLEDIDIEISAGEFVALVGKSGSGKSTLLRGLAGLDDGYQGEVDRPERVSVGFQDARLMPWARVWKNVVLGDRRSGAELRGLADDALAEVELAEKAESWPAALSGGQQQRASLARALYRRPQALFLDEPFGALDALTRLNMQALVHRLWEEHRFTTVLVTHEVPEAIKLADRIIVLADGRIAEDITVDMPRPRSQRAAQFEDIREHILTLLGVADP